MIDIAFALNEKYSDKDRVGALGEPTGCLLSISVHGNYFK